MDIVGQARNCKISPQIIIYALKRGYQTEKCLFIRYKRDILDFTTSFIISSFEKEKFIIYVKNALLPKPNVIFTHNTQHTDNVM